MSLKSSDFFLNISRLWVKGIQYFNLHWAYLPRRYTFSYLAFYEADCWEVLIIFGTVAIRIKYLLQMSNSMDGYSLLFDYHLFMLEIGQKISRTKALINSEHTVCLDIFFKN